MKLGLEDRKKLMWLAGLMVLAVVSYVYFNVLPDSSSSQAPASRTTATAPVLPAVPFTQPGQSTQPRPLITNRGAKNDEFHPVLRPRGRQGEPSIDPTTVDPTIHIELLAKVQDAKIEGGQRNLFQFGAAAPVDMPKGPEPIVKVAKVYDYPRAYVPPPPPAPKADPPPAPPSFKYYGLATKKIDNKRTAFFLDGEDIILATEGMTVKNRWRVVRINVDSVMLEDSQTRKQQALAISEEAGGTGTGNS
jgi:hypothetical protein